MIKKLDIDSKLEEICSVSEMARKVKLSRARFYQLQQQGVFPPPAYCIQTRKPFYPHNLQQQCIKIRQSGITAEGQPVFFYAPRKNGPKASRPRPDRTSQVLINALKKMGIKVTQRHIKRSINTLYPEGLSETADLGPVISGLFRYLKDGVSK